MNKEISKDEIALKRTPIFPSIGYSRLRMENDGDGVTTLVCAQGCPLRCRYCLNPQSSLKKSNPPLRVFTPRELYELVKIDDLYFVATSGGITFGGGEPLLYIDFLEEFATLAKRSGWKIYIESSLAISSHKVKRSAAFTDFYIVDVKDTNPRIYYDYTGASNEGVLSNLKMLIGEVGADKIRVRLPLIPGCNTDKDRDKSEKLLREWGITQIDRFTYRIPEKQ